MKKSIIFLINGLGIEKKGSYSISIEQAMPNFSKVKETSFFTTAIISSLEYKTAYQRFFLGDTYKLELDYIQKNFLEKSTDNNAVYNTFSNESIKKSEKIHIFVEPTNDKIVEQINEIVKKLILAPKQKVYLHLLLTQQTINEYDKLISIINYIKFHLSSNITVGFVIGKESLHENITKEELNYNKKLLFYCSAERWQETEKKLQILKENDVRPCNVVGFCTTNDCFIQNNDTVLFYNTKRDNYDNIIKSIKECSKEVFKDEINIPIYSLVKLYSDYDISSFLDNVQYENSLAEILNKYKKNALIISDDKNIKLVNFYANGLNSVNNSQISFMRKDDNLYNYEYVEGLINKTNYDLFIFDYHMDTSSTVNNLKEQLKRIDIIIGNLSKICENKHSLFITSLYGIKKELPIAEYNNERVLINYEMQIPIFFFDYTYPRSKYDLFPGETNDILSSALKCIIEDDTLYSLVRPKTLVGSVLKSFVK